MTQNKKNAQKWKKNWKKKLKQKLNYSWNFIAVTKVIALNGLFAIITKIL